MDAETRLKETVALVEATAFEQFSLWEKWNGRIKWEQMDGWAVTAGLVNGFPVVVSLSFARLNGKIVAFWDPVSRMVDHKLIEQWFDKNYKGITTDAGNFHTAVHRVEA